MEYNIFTGFAGLVVMWIICVISSKGAKTRTQFLHGNYSKRHISNFWFLVGIVFGAIAGGYLPRILIMF